MFGFLKSLFGMGDGRGSRPARFTVADLAARLGVTVETLRGTPIAYHEFQVPKRRGGSRTISAPTAPLKDTQRRILRRVLRRPRAHPCATGFERGHSIVTNALPHVGKDVVIRLDVQDFFASTTARRVERYFRFLGYDREATGLLTRLCTHNGGLPQGAPTSPRLSNLVNYRLDERLAALAERRGLSYSRYADDMTFSGCGADIRPAARIRPKDRAGRKRGQPRVNDIIHAVKTIVADEGYRLHIRRKLHIYRRQHRQTVTGLVVNERPNLPRDVRRRLRAVGHHLGNGRQATMTPAQFAGWQALRHMIAQQAGGGAAGEASKQGR